MSLFRRSQRRCPLLLTVLLLLLNSVSCAGPGKTSSAQLPPLPDRNKLILFGVDGADWDVIRPLIDAGKLPNFKKVVEGGSSGILRSMEPTLSPALWTTVATGMPPGATGIEDFIVHLPGGGYKPVTSDMRKVPAFWNLVGELGGRREVGVVAWLASWPAEPVHGYVVTSYLPYLYNWSTGRPLKGTVVEGIPRQTYPEALLSEIEPLKVKPEAVSSELVARFYDPTRLGELGKDASECVEGFLWSLASDETYRRIGLYLFQKRPVDLFAIYFGGVDVVSHRFWKFTWPGAMPYNTDAREAEILRDVIPAYYVYIDGILGEFLAKMDAKTTLVILSDHGFKPVYFPNKPTTSGHHRLEGVLSLYGRGIKQGATLEGAELLDVFPTVFALLGEPLSRQLPGKVLAEAFELPTSGRVHLDYVDAYPPLPSRASSAPSEEIDANVLERLKSLGYIR
jgi:predicted AlkP superfamily phosphohydrolase/phosphomutase